ncbi:hypothetical protein Prubr_47670 [Polymorphospora rubra]|uniref:Uncharacterized protein n=1 Tax=Polymorphospora rubra TaxID=338584 RepID=A0A810N2Y1_9ACTN|nr:hypothetical protein Prubr_47670 [Polymorphospora rubra]
MRAVTVAPCWVTPAIHASRTFCAPVKAKAAVQPSTAAVPVLVMVTCAVKPPPPCQVP